MKRPIRLLLLASAIIMISQVGVFGQDTAALQREIDDLKGRVADLEKQNARLKSELDGCLAARGGAGATNDVAAAPARVNKPAGNDADAAGSGTLSGMYGGFSGAGTLKVTFMDGHALEVVPPSGGQPLVGSYRVEGKTVFVDVGVEKFILQIIDNQTLRTTWEGSPVQLRRRR